MVDTYKNNPSFADAKTKAKVNGEYETVSQKVRLYRYVRLSSTAVEIKMGTLGHFTK